MIGPKMTLTLSHLRNVNGRRRHEWQNRDGASPWCGADWSNEMGGECGEAQNIVKKLRRYECGVNTQATPPIDVLHERLREELADVIITCDLVAMYYGVDLSDAVIDKFNATSEKQGLSTRF